MATSILTMAQLKALLSYDPGVGLFTWIAKTSFRSHVGKVAGSNKGDGYLIIRINCVKHRAHRLAWLYMTGEWPIHQIDHINGDRSDNRWENLREVTSKENTHNQRKPHRNNATGFLGVKLYKGRYVAHIGWLGKRKHIGIFSTPELAYEAYVAAKRQLHSSCTI